MRLSYTVEVDEAIRDKRDHFADEMRQSLATRVQAALGDGRVTRDESPRSSTKMSTFSPRPPFFG